MTVAALLNIALTFLLVPVIGILGAAWATAAAYFTLYVVLLALARPLMRLDNQLGFSLKALVASAAMAGVLWWIHPTGMTRLLLALAPAVFVYFASLFALGAVSPEERVALSRLASRKGVGSA